MAPVDTGAIDPGLVEGISSSALVSGTAERLCRKGGRERELSGIMPHISTPALHLYTDTYLRLDRARDGKVEGKGEGERVCKARHFY